MGHLRAHRRHRLHIIGCTLSATTWHTFERPTIDILKVVNAHFTHTLLRVVVGIGPFALVKAIHPTLQHASNGCGLDDVNEAHKG